MIRLDIGSVPWYRQHLVIFQYLRFLQCLFRSVLISCDVWRRSGCRSRFRRRSLRRPFTVNYFINLGVLRNCQHFNISLTESSSKSMSLIRWLAVVLAYLVDSDLCHQCFPLVVPWSPGDPVVLVHFFTFNCECSQDVVVGYVSFITLSRSLHCVLWTVIFAGAW